MSAHRDQVSCSSWSCPVVEGRRRNLTHATLISLIAPLAVHPKHRGRYAERTPTPRLWTIRPPCGQGGGLGVARLGHRGNDGGLRGGLLDLLVGGIAAIDQPLRGIRVVAPQYPAGVQGRGFFHRPSGLSPRGLGTRFRCWTQAVAGATGGEIIAVDGTSARDSRDRRQGALAAANGQRLGTAQPFGAGTRGQRGETQRDHRDPEAAPVPRTLCDHLGG